jgi:hypothetical protein
MDEEKKRKQLALLQRTQSQLDVQTPNQSTDLVSAAREVARSRMANVGQKIGQVGQMVANTLDAIPPSVDLYPGPLDNLVFMGLAGISKGIKGTNKIPTLTAKTAKTFGKLDEMKKLIKPIFNINIARKNISNLITKTNLTKFISKSKGSPNEFAYIEDLSKNLIKKYESPAKTVLSAERIEHLKKRPGLFNEVVEILPNAIKKPDMDVINPNRDNSFIVLKKGSRNYGVILEIDKIGEYNFVKTVQPMKNTTIQKYLKQSGGTANSPSMSGKPDSAVGQIVSDLQPVTKTSITQESKISQELKDFLDGKIKDTVESPVTYKSQISIDRRPDPTNMLNNIKEWRINVGLNPNNELGKDSAKRIIKAEKILKEMGVSPPY